MSRLRCAIYTRKSTDEGLDQAFNSLDAQREACEAYIQSQAGEGWSCLKARYDDGGFSGGSMERPGLKALLAEIETDRINVVVVYKVDRLTRSLADFARLVDLFDTHSVSFVSVTQQFNTTTSMGRLTLNVLLSFAQFEREVTGERIRDKIAASKKKGMWMGGVVPLGYDSVDKKLVINETEATTVRTLFQLYRSHANVRLAKQEADRLGLRTKPRKPQNGQRLGGEPFTRGHIYKLLANPIYAGDIVHKGERHAGEHEAIIDGETWHAVRDQLNHNAVARRAGANAKSPSLLVGLLFDESGGRLRPSHANNHGRRYRYYVSEPETENGAKGERRWRLPAKEIETLVIEGIANLLDDKLRFSKTLDPEASGVEAMLARAHRLGRRFKDADPAEQRAFLVDWVEHIELRQDLIRVVLRSDAIHGGLVSCTLGIDQPKKKSARGNRGFTLELPVAFKRRGVETKIVLPQSGAPKNAPDPNLIHTVTLGYKWFAEIRDGVVRSVSDLAERHCTNQGDVSRIIRFGLLAPDIVEAILDGRQPVELTAARLKRIGELPICWRAQRRVLGFA